MQLQCIHCREPFVITSEQLGGRGRCPHCQGEITLPDAEPATAAPEVRQFAWWENSVSTLVSLVVHALLLLVLALWTYGGSGLAGEGEEVLIGEMPKAALDESKRAFVRDVLEGRVLPQLTDSCERLDRDVAATLDGEDTGGVSTLQLAATRSILELLAVGEFEAAAATASPLLPEL